MGLNFDLGFGSSKKFDYEKIYDLIVIGGGPGGLSSALYAKRKGIDVAIISGSIGGQVSDTSSVENYLGIESMSGEGLVKQFKSHVEAYDVPMLDQKKVLEISNGKTKEIKLDSGEVVKTKTVIVATGSLNRKIGVPGEDEFYGKGVTYCAICDGPLFEGLDVIVSGGGNSAVEAAIDLSKIANSVKLVQRSILRADKVLVDKLESIENVEIFIGHPIKEVKGDKLVSSVIALNKETNEEVEFKTNALFVEIGYVPNTKFVENILKLNDKKEIIINEKNETSVEGIY
ncbi:FAD-dependent oxidoreductase, partial [Clostridiaceae bacterium HSG29]|nr:FAD-dependent oxidoreductase [Clostridiaceae bacterium HSG29]